MHFSELCLTLICLVLSVSYTSSQEDVAFSKACNDFTVNLLKTLAKSPNENILYSPLSINILLSAIHQGTRGETSEQLQNVLNLDPETSRGSFSSYFKSNANDDVSTVTFKMGNKMYLKPGFEINENFKSSTNQNFQMDVEDLDLNNPESVSIINKWVSNVTNDHITDFIQPGSLSPESVMLLLSAVFFHGKWAKPFSTSNPVGKFFTSRNEFVEVPYLSDSRRMVGGRNTDLGFKWVELPYEGETHSMILMLPLEEHKLDKVIKALSGDSLKNLLSSTSIQFVRLRLPRFSLKKRIQVQETLINMGITNIFSDKADLSGIGPGLKVSDMQHEAFLEVTAEGTKAAAASSMAVNTLSLTWDPDEMKFFAKQPFLAFIVDKRLQIPLFAARISNPI